MNNDVLIIRLREHAEWAEENLWEVPITLPDDLKAAADALEKLTSPMTISELGLSTRAYCGLYRRGITLVRDAAKLTEDELAKIPGIGVGTAKEIIEKIKENFT